MVGRGRKPGEGVGPRAVDWEEDYLAALARSGVIREAAAVAGIHSSMVHNRRQRSAEFRERHEAAMAARAARAAGTQLVVVTPQAAAAHVSASYSIAGGVKAETEFVVRTDSDGTARAIGMARRSWTTKMRAKFLAELASHGNVTRAARFVGLSAESAYKQRHKLSLFAMGWDMAIATGTAALRANLVEAARATFDPDAVPGPDPEKMRKVSVAEAIHIVKLKSGEGSLVAGPLPLGKGQRCSSCPPENPEEVQELRAKILAKLERVREQVIARHRTEGWVERDGYLCPPIGLVSEDEDSPVPTKLTSDELSA